MAQWLSHVEYWHFTRPLAVIATAAMAATLIAAAQVSFGQLGRWVPWAFGALAVACFTAIAAVAP